MAPEGFHDLPMMLSVESDKLTSDVNEFYGGTILLTKRRGMW